MKCSSRSTRSFASGGFWLLLMTAPLYGGFSSPSGESAALTSAIESAVRARVGHTSVVSVTGITGVRMLHDSPSLVAVPDPSARIGTPVRFVLAAGDAGARTRIGEATATVQVSAPAVRARKAIARGERLDDDAITVVATDLNGQTLRPLLSLDDARGARVKHDLVEGALITRTDIAPEPLVKAGDVVRARVHVGDVELVGSGVAAENGLKDEVIRVINQESRHAFRARVVGSGEVEVVDVR
jgi:flagella basal body P-ring formation protein FlgA